MLRERACHTSPEPTNHLPAPNVTRLSSPQYPTTDQTNFTFSQPAGRNDEDPNCKNKQDCLGRLSRQSCLAYGVLLIQMLMLMPMLMPMMMLMLMLMLMLVGPSLGIRSNPTSFAF